MATDFRDWIELPVWLRRPESVPASEHQLSLFARAVGAAFNGVRDLVNKLRRQWLAALATGRFLDEHGADRALYRRAGETDAAFRARVVLGLRAKKPGETKAGMGVALDTLGLTNHAIEELYRLAVEDPANKRWDEFEIRYPDGGNEALTDAQVQERINAAKPSRAKGTAVRYRGAVVYGFGRNFGAAPFGS